MTVYKAPVKDTLFVLKDVLGYERHSISPAFPTPRSMCWKAILEEGAKLARMSCIAQSVGRS